MTFDDLSNGQTKAFVQKAGGADVVMRVLRGELEMSFTEIKRLLARDASFDPASFIGAEWASWRGPADGNGLEGEIDHDPRSLDRKEIDWVKVDFKNFLKDGEPSISGEEKLKRQKEAGHVRFGGDVFLSLWQDYQKNKKDSVLEWLYCTHGITFLDFFGLVLRRSDGDRYVLDFDRHGDKWRWHCSYLGNGWNAHDLSCVPASDSSQPSVTST